MLDTLRARSLQKEAAQTKAENDAARSKTEKDAAQIKAEEEENAAFGRVTNYLIKINENKELAEQAAELEVDLEKKKSLSQTAEFLSKISASATAILLQKNHKNKELESILLYVLDYLKYKNDNFPKPDFTLSIYVNLNAFSNNIEFMNSVYEFTEIEFGPDTQHRLVPKTTLSRSSSTVDIQSFNTPSKTLSKNTNTSDSVVQKPKVSKQPQNSPSSPSIMKMFAAVDKYISKRAKETGTKLIGYEADDFLKRRQNWRDLLNLIPRDINEFDINIFYAKLNESIASFDKFLGRHDYADLLKNIRDQIEIKNPQSIQCFKDQLNPTLIFQTKELYKFQVGLFDRKASSSIEYQTFREKAKVTAINFLNNEDLDTLNQKLRNNLTKKR